MEKVFSHAWRGRHGTETKENLNLLTERQMTPEAIQVQYIDDEQVCATSSNSRRLIDKG